MIFDPVTNRPGIQLSPRNLGFVGLSGPCEFVRRHESCVSQSSEGHPAARTDSEPRNAAVVQAHP